MELPHLPTTPIIHHVICEQSLRLHWGSVSISTTRLPFSASIQPRLNVVVVLLTPPLWLNRAIILCVAIDSRFDWIILDSVFFVSLAAGHLLVLLLGGRSYQSYAKVGHRQRMLADFRSLSPNARGLGMNDALAIVRSSRRIGERRICL